MIRDEPAALADLESKIPGYFLPVPERNSQVTATTSPDLKSMVRGLKDQAEMQAIRDTLAETKWNRRIAATRLNISYKALLYKIRQYNSCLCLHAIRLINYRADPVALLASLGMPSFQSFFVKEVNECCITWSSISRIRTCCTGTIAPAMLSRIPARSRAICRSS